MYAGRPVETGTVDEIFYASRHPYTLGLLASLPRLDLGDSSERLYRIKGQPPSLIFLPSGCAFHPRCDYAQAAGAVCHRPASPSIRRTRVRRPHECLPLRRDAGRHSPSAPCTPTPAPSSSWPRTPAAVSPAETDAVGKLSTPGGRRSRDRHQRSRSRRPKPPTSRPCRPPRPLPVPTDPARSGTWSSDFPIRGGLFRSVHGLGPRRLRGQLRGRARARRWAWWGSRAAASRPPGGCCSGCSTATSGFGQVRRRGAHRRVRHRGSGGCGARSRSSSRIPTPR